MKKNLIQAIIITCLITPLCTSIDTHSEENTNNRFPRHLSESEWILVWKDEFLGEKLNESKWKHCPEWNRCDGDSKWSDEDAYLDGNGSLLLRIRKHDGRIRSGAVRTKGLFERRFGYFEIRCKTPVINGGWCAFWMMPSMGNHPGNDGRDGTEIDIYESIDAIKGNVQHALHWDGYGKDHKSKIHKIKNRHDLYEGYHTFGILWNENEYIFYIDDKETWRTSAGAVMQVPAYLKITIEAAKWAGDIRKEDLPKFMIVDCVRVYGRKRLGD